MHRYTNINSQRLPSRFGYAAIRRELYHKDWHKGARIRNAHGKLDDVGGLIFRDDVDGRMSVVENRLHTFIRQDQRMQNDGTFKTSYEQIFFTSYDQPTINQSFVCLSKPMPDHSLGRNALGPDANGEWDPDGPFVDGVEPWATVNVALDRAELERRGCAIFWGKAEDGKTRVKLFEVRMRVNMRCVNEQDIKIGFELVEQPASVAPYEVWEDLWDAKFSEFVE